MRQKIVAGNWKMHKNAEETEDLLNELIDKLPHDVEAHIIVAPAFVNLVSAVEHLEFTNIEVAAQNMHEMESGAYTGEVSADMLRSIGVHLVILGHSERRAYFHETDSLLAYKVDTALKNYMKVIFCFGEELLKTNCVTDYSTLLKKLGPILFWRTSPFGQSVQAKPQHQTKRRKCMNLSAKPFGNLLEVISLMMFRSFMAEA